MKVRLTTSPFTTGVFRRPGFLGTFSPRNLGFGLVEVYIVTVFGFFSVFSFFVRGPQDTGITEDVKKGKRTVTFEVMGLTSNPTLLKHIYTCTHHTHTK